MNRTDYQAIIKPFLSKKRYEHSICVCDEAVHLARVYDANEQKAETAGILHDIMKDVPPDEQLKMMMRYDILLTDVERSAQKLWHAMLGAAYIENELHISDPEILNAVRYHTTGRAEMTTMDKILFVADFISADRDYAGVEQLRKSAVVSLDQAVADGIVFTIQDLVQAGRPIHPDTIAAYNHAILNLNQN
ncbi:bis(5'-nucleosyl)-tetraphosphatase (symmetrical) YqeK [Caproiciproducens galactitolivorans]|uniref:Bis(5'-nucleosyl)-tetraphosphatase (Symmetrical) YqeK n=1 Tax=Caproiciproducens galactitolivorans TaxID=642589 RepID=A0ABT4BUP2_9FIRM|nr:bis(5'-nucleosyl)-tetraphosphatase (symmetrical) YqeK [Caproiciproducens galactitolivorans]MCY1714617.1 bis(5'-nucleosyl)-tetraphosphatase (symmetrical) YqeK [Caproiciproducens galactitolivorans]